MLAASGSDRIAYAGEDIHGDIRRVYLQETAACTITYVRSDDSDGLEVMAALEIEEGELEYEGDGVAGAWFGHQRLERGQVPTLSLSETEPRSRSAAVPPLRGHGIGTGVHYPVPVHRQAAYLDRVALGPSGCRATEIAAREVLSLPIYPELSDAQVSQVCEVLRLL